MDTIHTKEHKHMIEQLKAAREESGFDQETVAKKLKKTQSYVSKIESGQRRIDVVQLKQFAKVYDKQLEYFIN
jgi:transcriptional regulator with XRE-family HTH domain